MAWCPKCKIEYIYGIVKCTECGGELVDVLIEEKEIKNVKEDNGDKKETKDEGVKEVKGNIFRNMTYRTLRNNANIVAYMMKVAGVLFLLLGFIHSLYLTFGCRSMLKNQSVNFSWNLSGQQFFAMFGECVFVCLLLFSIGEVIQILHDIRKKLYEK